MLKLSWIEIFLRLIPEMLLVIWGIYELARHSVKSNMKKYIISSIVMGLATYAIRMLPIYFGVHTFIIAILTICIVVFSDIPVVKAIYGTLLMFLILSLSEFVNVGILDLLSINTNNEFANHIMKCILGIPSLVIIVLFILAIRYIMKWKEGRMSHVNN